MKLVEQLDVPSDAVCRRYGAEPGADWYSILRDNQGDVLKTLEAGVMHDDAAFAADSLFCEWAYVVDLDRAVFDVYRGFQKRAHEEGRFAALPTDGTSEYVPIRLVVSYPLADLPDPERFEADSAGWRE